MVRLDKVRSDLQKLLEKEQALQCVEVRADTLDEALADAAVQLGTRVAYLEYEVLEKGFAGVAGIARQPWRIRVYENEAAVSKKSKAAAKVAGGTTVAEGATEMAHKDGEFFIRYFGSDIYLKVTEPEGDGKPVSFQEVMGRLQRSDTISLENDDIKKYVKSGTGGVYESVGLYRHEPSADASFVVDVAMDETQATITATAPGVGGAEIMADTIANALSSQGIVAGIDLNKIDDFVDHPVYGLPYVVAEAIKPVDGRDAYIEYNFETDRSKLKMQESETGQVNFKELNLIQNVVEGQPLAKKIPAERGKGGKTIFGRYLEAKNGKDINLPLGKNVVVDSDGHTILAATNGQVLLIADKINVEPVMEIEGDVSIKTGNITFLGTVIVKGNVDDGFNIKASGNIEVYGTVGRSSLIADGNIIVSLGIMGRDEGVIQAGKSLWAKFIQNTTVTVEEFVIVADGIINSNVTARKRILLQGKRAAIIGGHLFATEEISAKTVGSSGGGSETILEVGLDPQLKQRMTYIADTKAALAKELEENGLDMQTLENMRKVRRVLPPEKDEQYRMLQMRRQEIETETAQLEDEFVDIQNRLRELKIIGKVSVAGTVYAGAKIFVRDVKDEIRTDIKSVTFFYENGFVRRGKYEAPDTNITKQVLDGYSST
ncbi:MAG: FapA family protein [Treponema sp.]|nr:FapA family protein [Treponema sp.]MDY3755108.1 FapA family protein [Treponema sp.]